MLSFSPIPSRLPAPTGVTLFPDHLDGGTLYYLPAGLELAANSQGEPDFFLLRYHGDHSAVSGGLLHFRLRLRAVSAETRQMVEDAGFRLRQVGFESGRYRLRLRSLQEGGDGERGDWHAVPLTNQELRIEALSLSPRETQFLQALLADEKTVIEMETDLRYKGLVPGLPWLALCDMSRLTNFLHSLLPGGPARSDQVIAAFLSLPSNGSPISWRRLDAGATEPDRDTLHTELALRLLPRLFDKEPRDDDFDPGMYRLRPFSPSEPAQLSVDLIPPRLEERVCRVSWSLTGLYQSLDTDEKKKKLFPAAQQVTPFGKVDVSVINRAPYDPEYLRKTTVDLSYTGAAGVPERRSFIFDGGSDLYRFSVFYPALVSDLRLTYRLTTLLAPPGGIGWPVMRKGDFRSAAGPMIEVDREATGMDFVRVEAEPELFEKAAWISVSIYRAPEDQSNSSLKLNAARRAAWVALPAVNVSDRLHAKVVAHGHGDPEPQPYTVRDGPVVDRRVSLGAWEIEALEPDSVTIRLDPQVANRYALITVTVAPLDAEGRTFNLGADAVVARMFFRSSVFSPLRYRYSLSYVAIDPRAQTRPLASTGWIVAEAPDLTVRPPES